jgi:hypothetical protein
MQWRPVTFTAGKGQHRETFGFCQRCDGKAALTVQESRRRKTGQAYGLLSFAELA